MYAKGMTTDDIKAHIQEIYGISILYCTVGPVPTRFCLRIASGSPPLESICVSVFLDAITTMSTAKDRL